EGLVLSVLQHGDQSRLRGVGGEGSAGVPASLEPVAEISQRTANLEYISIDAIQRVTNQFESLVGTSRIVVDEVGMRKAGFDNNASLRHETTRLHPKAGPFAMAKADGHRDSLQAQDLRDGE